MWKIIQVFKNTNTKIIYQSNNLVSANKIFNRVANLTKLKKYSEDVIITLYENDKPLATKNIKS